MYKQTTPRAKDTAMTTPSADQDLRRMLAEATPLPWTKSGTDVLQVHHTTRDVWYLPRSESDVALVVAAVNALPGHLDEIARLKGEVERLAGLLERLRKNHPDMERRGLGGIRSGVRQMLSGEQTCDLWAEVDAALAGRGGRKEGGE